MVSWGGCKQELGGPPCPVLLHLNSAPIPALGGLDPGDRERETERRQIDMHARAHSHTNTHVHSRCESGSSISPPSALLNPIVQTRAGHRGQLGPPAPYHRDLFHRARSPPAAQHPTPVGFTSSACDPWGARKGAKQSKGPLCHLLSWEETAGKVGPALLPKISTQGRPRACPSTASRSSADPF